MSEDLLAHSHAHVYVYCLWPPLRSNGRAEQLQQGPPGMQKRAIFALWTFIDMC